jgi:uncharacterized protein YcbX
MTANTVARLWRYPVKSMGGEEVPELLVNEGSVAGDRAYGFLEAASGRLVSAKRHGALLECRARFLGPPLTDAPAPPIEVTFPDGTVVTDDAAEIARRASALLGTDVRLVRSSDPDAQSVVAMAAPQTLADFAPVHVLAETDLDRLRVEYPGGDWDARRFRPNVLISDTGDDGWLGCDLRLGAHVVVHAVMPTSRCVMTTLPQGELPRDREVLRTLARVRRRQVGPLGELPCVGSYAEVVCPGVVHRGDPVRVERVEPRHGVLAAALDAIAAEQN